MISRGQTRRPPARRCRRWGRIHRRSPGSMRRTSPGVGPLTHPTWWSICQPGDYGVWTDDPTATTPAPGLTVTGDAATPIAAVEPEAAVTIIEQGAGGQGFTFQVDGEIQAGPQIVKIVNASDQPHFVIAGQYPEPVTIDQLRGG